MEYRIFGERLPGIPYRFRPAVYGAAFRDNRILVMEKGRIAEAGTHEELLAAGGLYSRMWKAQAENYVV